MPVWIVLWAEYNTWDYWAGVTDQCRELLPQITVLLTVKPGVGLGHLMTTGLLIYGVTFEWDIQIFFNMFWYYPILVQKMFQTHYTC